MATNLFIQVRQDFFEPHDKIAGLMAELDCDLHQASGLVMWLWGWAQRVTEDGTFVLSKSTPATLAMACRWTATSPQAMFDALVNAGWIDVVGDEAACIHDYDEHMGRWIKSQESRRKATNTYRERKRAEREREDPACHITNPKSDMTNPKSDITFGPDVEVDRDEEGDRDQRTENSLVVANSPSPEIEHSPSLSKSARGGGGDPLARLADPACVSVLREDQQAIFSDLLTMLPGVRGAKRRERMLARLVEEISDAVGLTQEAGKCLQYYENAGKAIKDWSMALDNWVRQTKYPEKLAKPPLRVIPGGKSTPKTIQASETNWDMACAVIARRVEAEAYHQWIEPLQQAIIEHDEHGAVITMLAPTAYHGRYVRANLEHHIADAYGVLLGKDVTIHYLTTEGMAS